MERLELRLQLYESCGEEHNARLKTMLERDEILKKQLHRLEEDNMKLRRDNQFLEMEKCEYEELENDTRLQCQRLEVKLNSKYLMGEIIHSIHVNLVILIINSIVEKFKNTENCNHKTHNLLLCIGSQQHQRHCM